MKTYHGGCHCGSVTFSFLGSDITSGVRCNCSICKRKGAVMSTFYLAPEHLRALRGKAFLTLYQFGDKTVKHYFCKTCGIYPCHEAVDKPGHYRINLGCVDGLDSWSLEISLIDGQSF